MIQWQTFIQPPRQGTLHKKHGNTPCQDKAVVMENDKKIVAVLADGLGQFEYSGNAADTITRAVSAFLIHYDYTQFKEELLKKDVLVECKRAMKECADDLDISVSQMDCTLLFIIVFKNGPNYILGQLGDGAICVVKKNQALQAATLDDKFKASINQTKAILSSDAFDYFNIKICSSSGLLGFFLTSDGLKNEIYSTSGKVKQKIQWYFNLISNHEESVCVSEIHNRWNELSAKETYGFTDDMSLIAIFLPNMSIELPDDTNWLCICGYRNRMESSRCESCGKDITKVYKGINFKMLGGKLAYFSKLNANPTEEKNVLRMYCAYPPEGGDLSVENIELQKHSIESRDLNQSEQTLNESEHKQNDLAAYVAQHTDDSEKDKMTKSDSEIGEPSVPKGPQAPIQEVPAEKTKSKVFVKKLFNKNIVSRIIIVILICLLGIALSLAVLFEIIGLQNDNETLLSRNKILGNKVDILNGKLSVFEEEQNIKDQLPEGYAYYSFSNGDVYIGNMYNNLPNGEGVVYSAEELMTGTFSNGKKNGTFYILDRNGTSKTTTYNNDIEVKTQSNVESQ